MLAFVTPPRMTWRFAPLDAHGLHPSKIVLQHEYQRRRAGQRHGVVGTVDFVSCVKAPSISVLQRRNWSCAFEHNGYGSRQQLMHTTTLKDLRLTNAVGLKSGCPTEGKLLPCLPSNNSKIVNLIPVCSSTHRAYQRWLTVHINDRYRYVWGHAIDMEAHIIDRSVSKAEY